MTHKDPTQQLLAAYTNLLTGQITYNGQAVTIGTRIPRKKQLYVHFFIEANHNYNTGDKVIYNTTVALQTVSIQEISEGDEEPANSVQDQLLQLLGDTTGLTMADFTALTASFGDSEYTAEMVEANYIITRKLRINHFIEQN